MTSNSQVKPNKGSLLYRLTSWREPHRIHAQPGDKIEFNRGVIQHVGIADGDDGVYHFSGIEKAKWKGQVFYRHDKIEEVADGDKVRINNTEDQELNPLPPSEILKSAEAKVGTGHNTYNFITNNCEHKATEMRYNQHVSRQAAYWEELTIAVVAVVFIAMVCLGSMIFRLFDPS